MRAQAEERGVDLLLVDAGDHHDGSGLVSTSRESADATDDIFGMLTYDVLTLGNHELYKYEAARWLYDNRKRWGGRYLTSNVNITLEEDGQVVSVPIADRFAKFETN
jgi:2',3'-cyclic-nucleotide 2'-phosphodiesterase (5'-nucleotidase family)